MRIIVRIKAGDSWRNQDLDVESNETILELKRRIKNKCGYRTHQQLWMKSINQLKDDDTVIGSGISDGDKVFVNVSNTDGEIHVDAESSDKAATSLPKNKEIQSVRRTLPPTTQSDWKCDVCGEFCSYDVCECDTCGQVRADHDPQDTESVTIQTTPEQPRPKETLTEDSHGSIAKVDGNASERFMTPKNTVGVSPVTSSLVVQSAVRQTVREDSHGSIATDDGNASGRYMTPINTVGVSPHTTSIINSSELRTYTDEPRVLVPTYQSSAGGIQTPAGRSRNNDDASHGGARSKIRATRLDAAQPMDYEWTCTTCKQYNRGQGTGEKCERCNELRSTITRTTSTDTWTCTKCTFENTLDSCEMCKKPMPNVTQSASEVMTNNTTTSLHGTTAADRSANRQQAEAPNATHGETTGIERVQDSPPTDKWICPACTFENALDRPGCEICTAERPDDVGCTTTASEQPSAIPEDNTNQDGWRCDDCTYVNLPTRPGCEACSSARPENYQMPKNYLDNLSTEEKRRIQQEILDQKEAHRLYFQSSLKTVNNDTTTELCFRNAGKSTCKKCCRHLKKNEGFHLMNCNHICCGNCLTGHITSTNDGMCPIFGCNRALQHCEVVAVIMQTNYKIAHKKFNESDMFYCPTEHCSGKTDLTIDGYQNTIHCIACKQTTCLRCRAIHTDVTCKQFQTSCTKSKKNKMKGAVTNRDAIECPGCHITLYLQKNHDWVHCRMCIKSLDWRKLRDKKPWK